MTAPQAGDGEAIDGGRSGAPGQGGPDGTGGGGGAGGSAPKRSRLPVILGVAVVVVLLAGFGVWWFLVRGDAPAQVAVGGGTSCTATGSSGSADGTWVVKKGENVFVGYRMEEIFGTDTFKKTAVGRTGDVTGSMSIQGSTVPSAQVSADVTTLRSDQSRRDNFIKGQALQTSTFPQATFTLTEPIQLPASIDSCNQVQATAKGDLTLHGQTRSVTVPVTARRNAEVIEVSGNIPITLADYGITAPDVGGFVKVDPAGSMELQLAFARQ